MISKREVPQNTSLGSEGTAKYYSFVAHGLFVAGHLAAEQLLAMTFRSETNEVVLTGSAFCRQAFVSRYIETAHFV